MTYPGDTQGDFCQTCREPSQFRSWSRDRNYASLSWECPGCGDYTVIPYVPDWNDDDDLYEG